MNAKKLFYSGAGEEDTRDVRLLEQCPGCGQCKVETNRGSIEWIMPHYLIMDTDQRSHKTKILRFTKASIPPILSGEKTITWRCEDEKNIVGGDILGLRSKDDKEFARALVVWTKNSTFNNLSPEDFAGHESFSDEKELLKTYSLYYKKKITGINKVKVIKFRLLGPED